MTIVIVAFFSYYFQVKAIFLHINFYYDNDYNSISNNIQLIRFFTDIKRYFCSIVTIYKSYK